MARKVIIHNSTKWRTSHLRAFVVRAAHQCFNEGTKPVVVVNFKPHRATRRMQYGGGVRGRAWLGSNTCTLWMTGGEVDRAWLAQVLHHEMGHMRGLDHKHMGMAALWRPVGRWRELFAWGTELPLELQAVRAKPAPPTVDGKIAHERARLARWEAKQRRAVTAIKKINRRLRYLERTAAKLAQTTEGQQPVLAEAASGRRP